METPARFDLKSAIENWRAELAAQSDLTTDMRRELETHLQDSIAGFRKGGLSEEEAFRLAYEGIGQLRMVGKEFKKVGITYWNKPLAVAAWMMFVLSLFVPVYDNLRGYECILWILPVHKMIGLIAGNNLEFITMEALNYAIFLMIASPILLGMFGKSPRAVKRLNYAVLVAVILAAWFILYKFFRYYGKVDIMPFDYGCFVWASSFVALYLSIIVGLKDPSAKINFKIRQCA